MLDQVTSALATVLQAKRDSEFQKKVTEGLITVEDIAEEVSDILYDTYSMFQDYTEDSLDDNERCISALYDIYDKMLESKTEEPSEDISSLGSGQAEDMVSVGEDTSDEKTGILETISNSILSLLKVNQDALSYVIKEERVLDKMQKGILKKDKKTKSADEDKELKGQGGEVPPIDPTKIDMSGVAKSMAQATAAQLSPAKLIKEFFIAVLPYLIILGLLLYGFITGYLGGDVWDFIVTLGGILIVAFLAYIAYQYVKAAILLAFQMMCEMLKVALAAQPALAAMIAISIIQLAFLLVAGLLLIMVAVAIGIFIVALAIALKFIVDAVISLLAGLLKIIVGIPLMILESFARIIKMLFGGGDDEESNKASAKTIDFLRDELMPKIDEVINAITGVGDIEIDAGDNSLDSLSSGIDGFNSSLSDMNKNMEELLNEKKTPEQTSGSNFTLFAYLHSLSTTVESIRGLVSNILDNNLKKDAEIIKQSVSSTMQESKNSSYNNYTVSDGAAILEAAATIYASKQEEKSSGTDLSGITKQLNDILAALKQIAEEAANAERDKSVWSFLRL